MAKMPWEMGFKVAPEEEQEQPVEQPEEEKKSAKMPWEMGLKTAPEEGESAPAEGEAAPNKYAGLTFDNLLERKDLLQTARDYYSKSDPEFATQSDEDVAKKFIRDRVFSDQNLTFGALPELFGAATEDDDEQKARLADLRAAWEELPAFWEEGGRGPIGLAENVGAAILDPFTYITGGVGAQAGKGAAKVGLNKAVSTVAGTAAAEGALNAAIEGAHQSTEQEIGVRDEYDEGQIGMAALIGSLGSVAPAGLYQAGKAIKNRGAAAVAQSADILPATPAKAAAEVVEETVEAAPTGRDFLANQYNYREDVPDEGWLKGKQEAAEKAMKAHKDGEAVPLGGSTTAHMDAVDIDAKKLKKLPGAMGEKRAKGDPKYDALMMDVQVNGKFDNSESPILIKVNHKGEAYIVEGNTRTAVANKLLETGDKGLKVRARIEWMNGGERVDGPWSPDNVAKMLGHKVPKKTKKGAAATAGQSTQTPAVAPATKSQEQLVKEARAQLTQTEGWRERAAKLWERVKQPGFLKTKLLDKQAGSRSGIMEEQFGTYDKNPVYRALRTVEATGNRVALWMEHGTFSFENAAALKADAGNAAPKERFGSLKFNDKGMSLVKVFEPVKDAEGGAHGFLTWVAANRMRAMQADGKPIPAGMTDAHLDAVIKHGESFKPYKDAMENLKKYNDDIVDFLETSGVIDADTRAKITQANGGWYVPFYRLLENPVTGDTRMKGRGMGETGLKRMHGSEEDNINDLLSNLIMNTETMVTAALHNVAKRQLFDRLLTEVPADKLGAIATKLPPELRASRVNMTSIKAKFAEAGVDIKEIEEILPDDVMTFFSRVGKPAEDNVITVMRNGKAEFWQINDELLLDGLSSIGHTQDFGWMVRQWAKGKRFFTQAITHEPTFIFRNAVRDAVSSAILAKNFRGRNAPFYNTFNSFYHMLKNDPEYQEFLLNGGGFSGIHSTEMGLKKLQLKEAYIKHGIDPNSVITSPAAYAEKLKSWWSAYDTKLSGVENASRFAEYQTQKRLGKTPEEAGFYARDVATDFSMRGAAKGMQFLTQVAPFFNPGVQGLYHTARRLRQDPVSVGWRAFTVLTLPTLALAQMNKEYASAQNQPDYIKDTHWIIPIGKDGIPYSGDPTESDNVILIPKPYDVGALFSTLPERFMNMTANDVHKEYGDAGAFLYHTWRVLTDQMLLDPTPWGMEMLKNQYQNQNAFGSPIVPQNMTGLEARAQKRPSTNTIAVAVGNALGWSPLRVEQAFQDMLGSGGTLVLDAVDNALRATTDLPARPLEWDKWPVVKAFYRYEPTPTQDEADFYNLVKNVAVPSDTFNYHKKEGHIDEIDSLLERIPNVSVLMGTDKALAGAIKTFGALNRQVRRIEADEKMSGSAKLEKIKDLKSKYQGAITTIMASLRKDPLLKTYMRESNLVSRMQR